MNPQCEIQIPMVCSSRFPINRHHRKMRSQGGTDHLINVIFCCGSGTTGCHGYIHLHPEYAYEKGWLVHSWDHPQDIPWRKDDTDL